MVNIVTSSDHLIGEELTLSPKVDMISFTGSTAVGQRIMEKGAATMKRTFLELGGKSATIVLDDADLGFATLMGMGACFHAGQGCAIQTRMLLPRSRYEEGVETLKGLFAAVPYGDPQRPDVIMGPVISSKQRERVLGLIEKGKAEGATLAVGGGRPSGDEFAKGWWVEPTLFTDVDNSMTIAQQEIFGPVLVVIPFEDEDDAVRIANDSKYGLSGGVFSGSVEHSLAVAKRVRTGGLSINGGAPVRAGPALRRVQAQRHRAPERCGGIRAVSRGQVAGLAGGLGRRGSRRDRQHSDPEVYYDPYDFDIDADPYPVWKRLRDEAPLYWNEKYEFFALSRWDDVDAAMLDWKTYISGRGSVLEIIKANVEIPPGVDPLRGPADPRRPPRPALAGLHAQEDAGARAPGARLLRRGARPAGRRRRLRLHQRPGQVHAHARHRHAARASPRRTRWRSASTSTTACASRRAPNPTPSTTPSGRRRCSPTTSTGAPSTRPTT